MNGFLATKTPSVERQIYSSRSNGKSPVSLISLPFQVENFNRIRSAHLLTEAHRNFTHKVEKLY